MPSKPLQINQSDDVQLFKQVIADYCQTWSTLPERDHPHWSKVYSLYADLNGLMFFDAVTPIVLGLLPKCRQPFHQLRN